jgi:hypothetical protein
VLVDYENGIVLNLYKPFTQLLDYSLFEENLVNFFFMGKTTSQNLKVWRIQNF